MAVTSKVLYRGYPLLGTAPTRFTVTNKVLTSNLATITTGSSHGITQTGTLVTLAGVDSTLDGTYAIASASGTSITFVKTTANIPTAAVSPVGIATISVFPTAFSGASVTNKVIQNYVATLTSASHGLAVNDIVAVTIGDSIYDTLSAQVIAVPSANTFCYLVTTQTAATTTVTQGAFGKVPPLYTAPSSTTAVATNVAVANPTANSSTFGVILDGISLLSNAPLGPVSNTDFDIKQPVATTKVIHGLASSQYTTMHISGVEIV
jgi:hypothetical protein